MIIGGGVIGLALAEELARRGQQVTILERGAVGRAASWAGAGILPPAGLPSHPTPYDQLRVLSGRLHRPLAERLRETTGIDNELSDCGGLHLAESPGEAAALVAMADDLAAEGVAVEAITPEELFRREPAVAGRFLGRRWLPGERQLRNPRHLQALVAACRQLGANIVEQAPVKSFRRKGERILTAQTPTGEFAAGRFCLASGAWTAALTAALRLPPAQIVPIRGQMLLYRGQPGLLRAVVNVGPRYLTPRRDGRILVGSTEEEAGFDASTTDEALAELRQFAVRLVPSLEKVPEESAWAGLRPCSLRGVPYLGRLAGFENAYIAAGHFRSGLYLSPGVAHVMGQLLSDETPSIGLSWFATTQG